MKSHTFKVPLKGFTLIELLIVITIILVLMGLIVGVGRNILDDRVKVLTTSHRMNQILTGLEQYGAGTDLAGRLQRVAGHDVQLSNLRSVISFLTDELGNDIRTFEREEHLPPRLSTKWMASISQSQLKKITGSNGTAATWVNFGLNDSTKIDYAMQSRSTWPDPSVNLDSVITFYDRQIAFKANSGSQNSRITNAFPYLAEFESITGPLGTFQMMHSYGDITSEAYYGSYGSTLETMSGEFLARRGINSPLGETLDGTYEVMPDAVQPSSWYYTQWPNLIEEIKTDSGGKPYFTNIAWAESDWNQSTPGTVPVVWPWPWGKEIFSRIEGRLLQQTEYRLDGSGEIVERTLADLSPLKTMPLLQAAGILAPDSSGFDDYRTDRSPTKPWNDAWGSPLIVVNASYMPARYDFDDVNDLMPSSQLGKEIPRMSRDAYGGRNFFMQKAKETYGYDRSFYVAVATAAGHDQDLWPTAWGESDDNVTLREIWLRISDVVQADSWGGSSWGNPPWTSIHSEDKDGMTCYISPPKEYR